MLELDLCIHVEPFVPSKKVAPSFPAPILFYLRHKRDERNFLVSFVLLDFAQQQITYFSSYSPKNLEKVVQSPLADLYQSPWLFKPHASLKIDSEGRFLCFVENSPYFYRVDVVSKKLQIYTGIDLPLPEHDTISQFVSTVFLDDEDPRYFYLTALHQTNPQEKGVVNYYRSTLDLKSMTKVFSDPRERGCPHATRKYKHLLLNSEFSDVCFRVLKTGEVLDRMELYQYVFKILFREFCAQINIVFSEDTFRQVLFINQTKGTYTLREDFDLYIKSVFGNKTFRQICDRREDFRVVPTEGIITALNVSKKELRSYRTTYSTPAHFELSSDSRQVFVSCHNFAKLEGRRSFFGPAALDTFEVRNDKLIKKNTFSDPRGYRFTSHKCFSFQGKSYLCTIGKPNRLFFIDATNMSLFFYQDIGTNHLDAIAAEDMADFLNYRHPGYENEYIALEVSPDGKFIFIVGHTTILIYNFEERRFENEIEILKSRHLFEEVHLSDFRVHTTHCQTL